MSYTRFNRHESMDSETRREIMDLISEIRSHSSKLTNMMYGLFDGYLYDEMQIEGLGKITNKVVKSESNHSIIKLKK